jgi:UDP-N-acetylmuramate dehydrogenase
MDVRTGEQRDFSHVQCRFAYRDSVFKQEEQDRYLITRVRFRLSRQPDVRLSYGDIRNELADQGISHPTPLQVSDAIMAIRQRKLPDPAVIGNAGSFFKNPVVSESVFLPLKAAFPELVAYPQADGVKLAAGWLIDQAGWKGKSLGPVGAYARQALVLVNHGGACGEDIIRLASAIQADVHAKFGVHLEMEPRVYAG